MARKHRKLTKRLHNMYAQSPDRRYAAQQLAELDSPQAILGLLGRFEKRTNNHTVDKEEKTEVLEWLVEMGDKVVEPTLEHLDRALNVNWPLRVLKHFLESDELAERLAKLLDAEHLEYGRNPERKEELVLAAGDFRNEELGHALVRMLGDANEPVRFLAVDAIFKGRYDFAREPIIEMLAGEEESLRVVNRILEQIVETDWTASGYKAKVEEHLPEGYALTRSGTIRRRGA